MDWEVNLKEEKGAGIAVAAPFSYGHHHQSVGELSWTPTLSRKFLAIWAPFYTALMSTTWTIGVLQPLIMVALLFIEQGDGTSEITALSSLVISKATVTRIFGSTIKKDQRKTERALNLVGPK